MPSSRAHRFSRPGSKNFPRCIIIRIRFAFSHCIYRTHPVLFRPGCAKADPKLGNSGSRRGTYSSDAPLPLISLGGGGDRLAPKKKTITTKAQSSRMGTFTAIHSQGNPKPFKNISYWSFFPLLPKFYVVAQIFSTGPRWLQLYGTKGGWTVPKPDTPAWEAYIPAPQLGPSPPTLRRGGAGIIFDSMDGQCQAGLSGGHWRFFEKSKCAHFHFEFGTFPSSENSKPPKRWATRLKRKQAIVCIFPSQLKNLRAS